MDFLANPQIQIACQAFLATILGAFIGFEREVKKKGAGLQTYSLVCLGTCLFTIITFNLFYFFSGDVSVKFDPASLIQAVAVGIGFIGAGVIFHQQSAPVGLTTAAGLWTTAAIGVAIGAKLYFVAIFAAFLTVLILAGFGLIEDRLFKKQ